MQVARMCLSRPVRTAAVQLPRPQTLAQLFTCNAVDPMLPANGHLLHPWRQPSTYCSLRTVACTSWTCTELPVAFQHICTGTLLGHDLLTLHRPV
jgi:hypothetical protein